MHYQPCAFHSFPHGTSWPAPAREQCLLTPPNTTLQLPPPLSSSTSPLLECKLWVLWWWVLLVLLSLAPSRSHAAILKVGVVGPWNCDPVFARAMPAAAAHLAVSRINRDPSLSRLGTTFDYVLLEEDCETSHALGHFLNYYRRASAFVGPTNPGYWDAASLLGKSWGKAVFSWMCVGDEADEMRRHPNFACTSPLPTLVLISVMRHFRWAHVGIISSAEDIWVETASKLANALRGHGFPVGIVASIGSDPASMRRTLAKVKKMKELRSKFF